MKLIIPSLLLICVTLFAKEEVLYQDKIGLTIEKTKATYNQIEIYNSNTEELTFINDNKVDNCNLMIDIKHNPLSLVGNYYSYEYTIASEAACGPPGSSAQIKTIDITTLKKVSITDLFTEQSIINAIKNDSWINQQSIDFHKKIAFLQDFEQTLTLLNELSMGLTFTADGFTIASKELVDGKINIRLVAREYMGFNHHRHLQLGLWLTPKEAFKKTFLTNTKFILGDYQNGLVKHPISQN